MLGILQLRFGLSHFRSEYGLIHLPSQDFVPKLKQHLLPRIQALLSKEEMACGRDPLSFNRPEGGLPESSTTNEQLERDSVLFKDNRMYKHQLVRINYTTYDVRRSQDVINPNTTHRDIMLLANTDNEEESSNPRFLYARVLGIYHVNVIYTGPGMLDYRPRRLEFLWVRHFHHLGDRLVTWGDFSLDQLCFPPMASDDAFGFIDPNDVLRGSHIIPSFKIGKVHQDEVALSRCAGDAQDWGRYVVNRCVKYWPKHLAAHYIFRG